MLIDRQRSKPKTAPAERNDRLRSLELFVIRGRGLYKCFMPNGTKPPIAAPNPGSRPDRSLSCYRSRF